MIPAGRSSLYFSSSPDQPPSSEPGEYPPLQSAPQPAPSVLSRQDLHLRVDWDRDSLSIRAGGATRSASPTMINVGCLIFSPGRDPQPAKSSQDIAYTSGPHRDSASRTYAIGEGWSFITSSASASTTWPEVFTPSDVAGGPHGWRPDASSESGPAIASSRATKQADG